MAPTEASGIGNATTSADMSTVDSWRRSVAEMREHSRSNRRTMPHPTLITSESGGSPASRRPMNRSRRAMALFFQLWWDREASPRPPPFANVDTWDIPSRARRPVRARPNAGGSVLCRRDASEALSQAAQGEPAA